MIGFSAPWHTLSVLPRALAAWKIAGRERRTRKQRHACCVQRNAYLEVKPCYCELQKAKLLRSCPIHTLVIGEFSVLLILISSKVVLNMAYLPRSIQEPPHKVGATSCLAIRNNPWFFNEFISFLRACGMGFGYHLCFQQNQECPWGNKLAMWRGFAGNRYVNRAWNTFGDQMPREPVSFVKYVHRRCFVASINFCYAAGGH